MNKIINFFKNKWVIQLIGIIALCLLVWFVGPLISIADIAVLESMIARVISVFVIFLLWLFYALWTQLTANRANAKMVDDLSDAGASADSSEGLYADQEVDELKTNFDSALETLKKTSSKTSQGKHYLYDLPWYVIIGPPGSGKTTALINSGLEFPLADRFGKNAVQGVGGTRNCDWWFTDQAVMLDTAGRYTTQDSHEQIDKAAWLGFLDLLKKHRPRRPLNGVLITMSLSDLLHLTEEERSLHAKAIRQRIEELAERTETRIPIYMLFTKTDLIAGFTDFFADFGVEERKQVWGVTFSEQEGETQDKLVQISQDYDDLLVRLNQRVNARMQDERDLNRRNLIFGFPQRISMLKDPVVSFLEECFAVNRYQSAPLLRGVYLTSGTQEGTPIDRLMGVLAKTFKLNHSVSPIFSGKGKSYFITRLLQEVIFAESGLVGLNQKVEKRRTLLQRAFYTLALLLITVCSGLWVNSYLQNQSLLREYTEKTAAYTALTPDGPSASSDLLEFLKEMDALRAVRDVYPESDVSWLQRLGLYQGHELRALAVSNYEKQLKYHFLPRIKNNLERRMLSEESNNPEVLYQLLRVYLMLGDADKANINIINPWVKVDLANRFPVNIQQQIIRHLDELLKLSLPDQQMDEALIKEVREILTAIPVARQVYMRIKADALQNPANDFILINELGASGEQVFATENESLGSMVIPGLFTYKGFHQVFLGESKDIAKQAVEQRWVLGEGGFASIGDLEKLEGKLFNYYYADYIKRWDALLANISIRRPANIHQSVEILEVVSGYDSPLRKLFEAVDRETSLTRVAALNEANALNKLKEGVGSNSRMGKLLSASKSLTGESLAVDRTGKPVEQHFARINEQVKKGAGGRAPIDQVIADLSELYATMADLGSTSGSGAIAVGIASGSGGGDVVTKIQQQSARLPEPMKGLVKELAAGNQGLIMGGVRTELSQMLRTDVSLLCKSSIQGRYPFAKSSRVETTLQDFGRFFSQGGVMDQFFQTHLATFVDTSRRRWRVISKNNQTVGITASTLRQFQNAAKIREVFFQGGGQLPSVQFELKPLYLDAKASKFWLNLEGQQTSYRHGPTRSMRFSWPGTSPGLVRFGFETLEGKQLSDSKEGDWAWFRLLDKMQVTESTANTYIISFKLGGLTAKYELRANSVLNPFSYTELAGFQCPSRI
ncbi:MAG: type VI secretion system membrane subunit TssM [Methyloprofundus sp.]|nr:type VI secretion system membrane subunit TssM [Methyloprofundus sp.]